MSIKTPYIWRNGEFIWWDECTDHNVNHSLHYWSWVFEWIRFYSTDKWPKIFRLKEHIERLFYSAKVMNLKMDFSEEEVMKACIDTVAKSGVESGYIRPIVYQSSDKMSVIADNKIDVVISVWPWGKYLWDHSVSVKIPKTRRIAPQTADMSAKVCGYYSNSILASQEILWTDFDEILLLDIENYIAEGSWENVFFIKWNEIHTPELWTILPWITRFSIIQILKERFNIDVIERKIKPEEIKDFDEAFFTWTAAEVTVIWNITDEEWNKIEFKNELSEKIKTLYLDIVAWKEEQYIDWLY